MLPFRDLTANTMNKLVRIPGIVISASVLSSRATKLHLTCRSCNHIKTLYPTGGLGGVGSGTDRGLPRVCEAPVPEGQKKECPMDPYIIVHSKSMFSDHQILKLQEAPDMVPVGELPRHMLLSADRYLTGQVVPGSRVIATGVYSTYSSGKDVRTTVLPMEVIITRATLFVYCYRKLQERQHYDLRIFVWYTWNYRRQPSDQQVDRIRLESSFLQKKRKNLARWREVRDSTSGLPKVLPQVFLGVLVSTFLFCVLLLMYGKEV
jgi:DNA replicative helicase MCM subunit Mcm2 (Cdc46/Mcm family)